MDLHPAIQAYFEADRDRDRDALTEAFAAGATVVDEGRSYVGRDAIGAWWSDAKTRYQSLVEPLEARDFGGATHVRAKVAGNFPASPATLTFAFRLEDDRIKALEIGG